jgi:hypothetical protein
MFLLAIVLSLTLMGAEGCPGKSKNKVEASICVGKNDCYIIHTEGKEKRTVAVTRAIFESCKVDYEWPSCGDGIHNGMRVTQLDNDPYRSTKRNAQNRNARSVCVQSISDPDAMITNTWFIGQMDAKTEEPKVQGIFTKCALAQPGQTAYIKSEHHAIPSTLLCQVYVFKNGQKWPLDFIITQALGDCVAQAVVPE